MTDGLSANELPGLRELRVSTAYVLQDAPTVKFKQTHDEVIYDVPNEAWVTLVYHWSDTGFTRRMAQVELRSHHYVFAARYGFPVPAGGWSLDELDSRIRVTLGIAL